MHLDLVVGIYWYAAFVFSAVFHEAAHALAATRFGDETAYLSGQLTLDPYPHMRREPFGMIIFPIVTFIFNGWMMGWASVPYNPIWEMQYPKKAAMMSLAGPLSNLLLSVTAGTIMCIGVRVGFFTIPDYSSITQIVTAQQGGVLSGISAFLSIIFMLNLCLFVFNLIPFPPLDGSSIIAFFISKKAFAKYQMFVFNPQFRIFGLIIAWSIFDLIFYPIFGVAMRIFILLTRI